MSWCMRSKSVTFKCFITTKTTVTIRALMLQGRVYWIFGLDADKNAPYTKDEVDSSSPPDIPTGFSGF
uniref:Secreted protein n=1 Tax=Schistosoma curassoni TaxID=6186 RepID=A0A183JM26_9TREM